MQRFTNSSVYTRQQSNFYTINHLRAINSLTNYPQVILVISRCVLNQLINSFSRPGIEPNYQQQQQQQQQQNVTELLEQQTKVNNEHLMNKQSVKLINETNAQHIRD